MGDRVKESNRFMHVITLSISLTDIEIKIQRGRERDWDGNSAVMSCDLPLLWPLQGALISPTHPATKGTQILTQTHSRTPHSVMSHTPSRSFACTHASNPGNSLVCHSTCQLSCMNQKKGQLTKKLKDRQKEEKWNKRKVRNVNLQTNTDRWRSESGEKVNPEDLF